MSALQKLVDRCNELDITEQLNIFGDASIQFEAKKELAALQARVAELETAHNRIIEMCTYEEQVISMCSCGKPNGIPAIVSCAKTAVGK